MMPSHRMMRVMTMWRSRIWRNQLKARTKVVLCRIWWLKTVVWIEDFVSKLDLINEILVRRV